MIHIVTDPKLTALVMLTGSFQSLQQFDVSRCALSLAYMYITLYQDHFDACYRIDFNTIQVYFNLIQLIKITFISYTISH